MRRTAIRSGTISMALLASVGLAVAGGAGAAGQQTGAPGMETTGQASPGIGATGAAQGQLNLTSEQKQQMRQSLRQQDAQQQQQPAGFQPTAGASVPQEVTLQPLPPEIATQVPAASGHQFARMQDDSFVIADQNRQIVEVIQGDDAVGAAPADPATPADPAAPAAPAPGATQ
jgi:hypothetical protein